jgi:hypothetical protein
MAALWQELLGYCKGTIRSSVNFFFWAIRLRQIAVMKAITVKFRNVESVSVMYSSSERVDVRRVDDPYGGYIKEHL